VFEALRGRAERHKEREFEVLPLKPTEQESFLAGALEALGRDPAQGKVVHRDLQSNAAVRALSGNPLMLSLIADVSDRMSLPATRAAFYREAVQAMWHRKLPRSQAERLLAGRDDALIELAQEMALERVEHTLVALIRTSEAMAIGSGPRWSRLVCCALTHGAQSSAFSTPHSRSFTWRARWSRAA
jgi:hypothetical protein